MIRREQLPELRNFARAEKELPLKSEPRFANLVVPNGNASAAVHRWFKYKEAFSADLLAQLIPRVKKRGSKKSIRLLDPYCGVGTGLVSAQLHGGKITATGIECNPFSAFVASAKTLWPVADPKKLRRLANNVLDQPSKGNVTLPSLSSIAKGRCITRHMARQVTSTRLIIEALPPCPEREILMLGLASVIEQVSRVRRDGRALRIVEKHRVIFKQVLRRRLYEIAEDIERLQRERRKASRIRVALGDGRKPRSVGIKNNSIDVILTSPPYPNNIDYNEVYKLELWLLGHVHDSEEFLTLRHRTFRSHPTCRPLDGDSEGDQKFERLLEAGSIAELMKPVVNRVSKIERKDRRGRSKVLVGYIYDTWMGLRMHYKAPRRGGRAFYVVGNSLHGGADRPYLIPTDLILATLAREIGFEVEELIIARGLQRRLAGNHFLRDSIVVLRKG